MSRADGGGRTLADVPSLNLVGKHRGQFLADVEPARSTLRTDMRQGSANMGGNSLPTPSAYLAWATGLAKLPMGILLMVRVA